MQTETDNPIKTVADFFPMASPREKQSKAMGFIERAYLKGYRDVVIAAPTGAGKSFLGIAACLWAKETQLNGENGGYYLVTQKLLQDQLERDFGKFKVPFNQQCASVKSSVEYPCPTYGTCMAGSRQKGAKRCTHKRLGSCQYTRALDDFKLRPVSVTNYPFYMTERTYVRKLNQRKLMILDECHSIEKQILGFVDVTVNTKSLSDWAPHLRPLPTLPTAASFCAWLTQKYAPVLKSRLNLKNEEASVSNDKRVHQELMQLENHYGRVLMVCKALTECEENWVYWQESEPEGLVSTAKPIEASDYAQDLLYAGGDMRIFMSAYPGPKDVFCRSIGLDQDKVAWCSIASTFPIAHRPVHMLFVGSMAQSCIQQTTPLLLNKLEKILAVHKAEKGIIHCNSYKIGNQIYSHLRRTEHAHRLVYPTKAEERNAKLHHHSTSPEPTVLLSPSMTEGFSLDDGLARWQVLAKCPYPYLGDRQIMAKKSRDPDWYAMQTAMTVIQACGRIVRSEEDWGVTYILDADFGGLFSRYSHFFPNWFTAAFQWH